VWRLPAREAVFERRLRLAAVPLALLVAWLLVHGGLSHVLLRTFFSMWVHETGHALAAWLCGLFAFPGPWFTPVGGERSWLIVLLVTGAIGLLGYRAWRGRHYVPAALIVLLLPAQLMCTFGLSHRRVEELVLFGGDAGCMLIGTLLMTTFYVRKDSSIRTGWLRWGFLVIGAAAFADAFATWWAARTNLDAIPFGENEGTGPSDPSRLVDMYGWSVSSLIHRYVSLGLLCLIVLAIVYGVGLGGSRPESEGPQAEDSR
jgi:hypothetical protein